MLNVTCIHPSCPTANISEPLAKRWLRSSFVNATAQVVVDCCSCCCTDWFWWIWHCCEAICTICKHQSSSVVVVAWFMLFPIAVYCCSYFWRISSTEAHRHTAILCSRTILVFKSVLVFRRRISNITEYCKHISAIHSCSHCSDCNCILHWTTATTYKGMEVNFWTVIQSFSFMDG